jgi:hypothetical protein
MSFCLFAWLIVSINCHAQNSVNMEGYQDSPMVQRWNAPAQKAIEAMKPGKKNKKDDLSLQADFSGKTFTAGGGEFGKSLSGIKNPWFGRKTVETDKASLWSKTDIANANKSFAVDAAATREFYQADKKAGERLEPVPTRSTKVEPKAQGMMDKISSQKNLTVEQVRELLNKN